MNSTHITTIEELAELIGNLTINEAFELKQILKNKFQTTVEELPTCILWPFGMPISNLPEIEPITKNGFLLIMTSYGSEKIKIIKAVKNLTQIGLTESKYLVEHLPANLIQVHTYKEALNIQDEFNSLGATVIIKNLP
jgi:large subunit ribosomal protein L7/L12